MTSSSKEKSVLEEKLESVAKYEKDYRSFSGLMAEPTMRYFETGGCVCDFGVALRLKDEEETEWLNCKAYGRLAERFGEYSKGTRVFVMGYFETSEYKGKEYVNFRVVMGE